MPRYHHPLTELGLFGGYSGWPEPFRVEQWAKGADGQRMRTDDVNAKQNRLKKFVYMQTLLVLEIAMLLISLFYYFK